MRWTTEEWEQRVLREMSKLSRRDALEHKRTDHKQTNTDDTYDVTKSRQTDDDMSAPLETITLQQKSKAHETRADTTLSNKEMRMLTAPPAEPPPPPPRAR